MLENILKDRILEAFSELYEPISEQQLRVQKTRKEVQGDYTVNVFPFIKLTNQTAGKTATVIGEYLVERASEVASFSVIKGFLNLSITADYWLNLLQFNHNNASYGFKPIDPNSPITLIEYSSPNTNKPLHLGHIRNNLLGYSVSELLKANGSNIAKVNLVNDRGIHICKSMVAWLRWGEGATPESTGIKGDKLVGNYYVMFDKAYKKEIEELVSKGQTQEAAEKNAPIFLEAQKMLRDWEARKTKVRELWKTMNAWVYEGFDVTYNLLGIDFDKIYYESDTYLLGKEIVLKGLKDRVLYKEKDGSIWADLTDEGLDQKLLLRSDGTSVYMTQDIGTAKQRFEEYDVKDHLYVVGNEQDYHFKVLKIILNKLGYTWSDRIHHLSYGMVELPEGKMKSREGTVVDADDLIAEMVETARKTSEELGKLDGYSEVEKEQVFHSIALGALKYFMLKVEPRKGMMFNPKESIDFNGNTGPFIQYTYARIQSILRKWDKPVEVLIEPEDLSDKENELIKKLSLFPSLINDAAKLYSPSMLATYVYELSKEYNQFYHEFPILKEEKEELIKSRLAISTWVANTLKNGMSILGISMPERM